MVDRKIQKITSPYGDRIIGGKKQFHKGVDLRVYNFANWKKQAILFPERCRVIRIGYQAEWGWNVVVATKSENGKDYELKFIHLEKPDIHEGLVYDKGYALGWTTVTPYMKAHKYPEHLHFEVWDQGLHIDPVWYFDERGISYA